MQLWAVARCDFSLSYEEFSDLTPSMFRALCERRNIHFKHDRYTAGMTAAAIYNVNRGADSPTLTAFDFVREEKDAQARAATQQIKSTIQQVVGAMPSNTPTEKFQDVRSKTIAALKAEGREDGEELFDSVWPSLRPAKEQTSCL